jgi:hypothetical protein
MTTSASRPATLVTTGRRVTERPTRRPALGRIGVADPRDERPEEPASGQAHGRRQDDEGEEDGDDDAGGARQADTAHERRVGEQEREQADDHGARAREDRRSGRPDRLAHRLATVLVATQLLAVAGDEQQGVVGARAEHQHGGDAGRRPVDGDVADAGDRLDDLGRHAVAEADDGERDQPEPRAAVGHDQQQRHDARRRRQEPDVRSLEHGAEVGLDGGGAGHLRGEPGRECVVDVGP